MITFQGQQRLAHDAKHVAADWRALQLHLFQQWDRVLWMGIAVELDN